MSLRTLARRFVCIASGFELIMRIRRIRMLARPAVGERKAKCPGRAYPSNEHEGDTNVDAAIRRHGEFRSRAAP